MEAISKVASEKLIEVAESLGVRNVDPRSGLIFVTGGTGVVGHRVAKRLIDAGYPSVRLGAQKPDGLKDMETNGAEVADFAWDKEESYARALEGVKTVLCTIPYTQNWDKHFPAFLAACKESGVKHFVKLSFYHARVSDDPFQQVPLVRCHGDCDDLLIRTVAPSGSVGVGNSILGDVRVTSDGPNMSYTILYASHLMSNPFIFQGKELRDENVPSTFYGASGNRGVNYVSPNDVAEVAVRVMLQPREHCNKEYTLTGPEPITEQEVAGLLSKHLKKPIMYVNHPLREFTRDCNKHVGDAGPGWMVRDLVELEKVKATGNEENRGFVSDDVNVICGHKAESFEEYLMARDVMTHAEEGA